VVRVASGDVKIDGAMTDGLQAWGEDPLYEAELEPGEYHIVSYQRPSAGNCGQLDTPTDRCEATVDLESGQALTVTVVLGEGGGYTTDNSS
jgi:hypothetical protein